MPCFRVVLPSRVNGEMTRWYVIDGDLSANPRRHLHTETLVFQIGREV